MNRKKMVLLVDNDRIHLLLLKGTLGLAGIEASCARCGEEALQEMAEKAFNCMITELNMPRMNGLDLARKAKELAPRMLVALCTGDEFPSIRWIAAEAGIDTVLSKPVNIREMLNLVCYGIQCPDMNGLHEALGMKKIPSC